MKRLLKWIAYLFLGLVALGAIAFVHVWYFKPLKVDWFYGRVFAQFALQQPELLTSLRLLNQFGLDFPDDDLSDSSPAAEDRASEQLKADYQVF